MYISRTMEEHVKILSRTFPVVMVTGPRQVGKTTLLRHLAAQDPTPRRYVTLDELGPRSLAADDPSLFLQRYEAPLLLDEVQHAPALLDRLKAEVDRDPAMGRYWVTGSQHFPLLRRVSESLAGRVGLLRLGGLTVAEETGSARSEMPFRPDRVEWPSDRAGVRLLELFARIVRGSLPRMAHPDAPPWEAFYGSYLQTYVERDVRSMLNVSDLAAFQRFLRLAAARIGQLLNYSDLARDTGVAVSTAREWVHALEASQQLIVLRPYFENLSKRQIKTPKLYFLDTGLVCYLTGWRSAEAAASGAMAGALLENHVVSEVVRSFLHRGVEPPVWYWRDKERHEVDLLVAEEGRLFPVEVKLSASPSRRDLSGIRQLQRIGAPLGRGAVIALVERPHPLTETVDALPVDAVG
jgi:predicted AAA+ superfamily ATPase